MDNLQKRFLGRDVISIRDFSREELDFLFETAGLVESRKADYAHSLEGAVLAPWFFEKSSRTNTSFQLAMHSLGGQCINFNVDTSSVGKGENLKDNARMLQGYNPDFAVIRHPKDGSARLFADLIDAPVINAGDGKNEHPTQAMLDLYSMRKAFGRIEGLKVAMAGDLKYGRTVHSLALALQKYCNCEALFISPESLRMPAHIRDELSSNSFNFSELGVEDLGKSLGEVDMIYMTRVQRERFPEGADGDELYRKVTSQYTLKKSMLEGAKLRNHFVIMHPQPKVDEIEPSVDETPFAYYYEQEKNGVPVRAALLHLIGGGKKK